MARGNGNDEEDPRCVVADLRTMLVKMRDQARVDVGRVTDDKAQALFEVTAEVLEGLIAAYEQYEEGVPEAWPDEAGVF